jgi:GTP-binding protein
MPQRLDLRNIAIIAHVDHGKTTLVDGMLRQTRTFRENQAMGERIMDSNDLERERGITILAKNTAVLYTSPVSGQTVKINIVDTPGHADFGGEVERVLNMVDGVLLLVDAVDGPMPQTRFVLRKALEMGHKAIVVINKIDRPQARPEWVANATFDLFIDLGASEAQAEFPIIYTDAIRGVASTDAGAIATDLVPLFEAIIDFLPAPAIKPDHPAQMLVTLLAYDDYKGRIATGRLFAGTLHAGAPVTRVALDGTLHDEKIAELFVHQGLQRIPVDEVQAGEIVAVTGLPDIFVGETIAGAEDPHALPPIRIEEPTVRMTFGVNTSPFGGREGKWSTSRQLRERLFKELETNVALRVETTDTADTFLVSGRGELHLAILIETMRREGYEFQVSKPEVIFHDGPGGQTLEPTEEVYVEVAEEFLGVVVEMLGARRGQMQDIRHAEDGTVYLKYIVPTRGLLGFRSQFLTATRGTGIIHALFAGYAPLAGEIRFREHGSLVAWEPGLTTNYGLAAAAERGVLFVGAGIDVYEGMIVGQHQRDNDLNVNVCKKKKLTNMRASTEDIAVKIPPPRNMSLDEAIEYIAEDELVEVTPINLRLRKRVLDSDDRRRAARDRESEFQEA